jgi:hypothetical protein
LARYAAPGWLVETGRCSGINAKDVARLSPLVFGHINLLGRYAFAVPEAVSRARTPTPCETRQTHWKKWREEVKPANIGLPYAGFPFY